MTEYEMMKNGDIPFESYTKARTSDPYTSHMAAQSINPSAHYALIIDALKLSPAGKTLIAKRAGLHHGQVARRLTELERNGLITLTGKTVKSDSNRQEREWILK
jgi:predicted Rossmann fold nucleotide-binding protein DprA/Smf involved in DNA uptake